MSDNTYTPKAGSLAEQVVNFFRVRPQHTLTIDEIRESFSVKGNIPARLEEAIAHGLIERLPLDRDTFAAGPKLPLPLNPSAISQPKPQKGPGRGHGQLPAFDVDAATVEKGVPIPAATVRKKLQSKWAPLLAKLTEKGDSIALPDQYRGTIDSYIKKLAKAHPNKVAHFKTGRDDSGVTRIWRIA